MANRHSHRVRLACGVIAALAATGIALPTLASAAPDTPSAHKRVDTSSITSVQHRLTELKRSNDELVEQFDQVQTAVAHRERIARAAVATQERTRRQLAHARRVLGASAAALYEGSSFSSADALLSSNSGTSYLDRLDTMTMLDSHSAQVVSTVSAAQTLARAAASRAGVAADAARHERSVLSRRKDAVQSQLHKYRTLLNQLTAEQKAALDARTSPTANPQQIGKAIHAVNAAPKAAQIAVKFAIAQVGKPYVWGSAGPDSYDCSGLTMSAYHAAGISLPHSAAGQYNYGRHIAFSQLQPGDLLFFYQPIGHVAIYVGNNLMVSAPQTGEDVKFVPTTAFGSDYTGATRLVHG